MINQKRIGLCFAPNCSIWRFFLFKILPFLSYKDMLAALFWGKKCHRNIYLNNYWTDCCLISYKYHCSWFPEDDRLWSSSEWYRYSWSPEDDACWVCCSPDFSSSTTMRRNFWDFSEMSCHSHWTDCRNLVICCLFIQHHQQTCHLSKEICKHFSNGNATNVPS